MKTTKYKMDLRRSIEMTAKVLIDVPENINPSMLLRYLIEHGMIDVEWTTIPSEPEWFAIVVAEPCP